MKKLLLATVAFAVLALPAQAAVIRNLGVNPTSATGQFSNSVGGGVFQDQYLFTLTSPLSVTFASATNDFIAPTDFITAFTGQLFSAGANGAVGGGDDVAVNAPVQATSCTQNAVGCQILAGVGLLTSGTYYLQLTGIGGGTSGYGGNLTTSPLAAVVPIPGMALAVPIGAFGLAWVARRRKQRTV